ncbi:MAG: GNAT family N-acetyltransferase [Coriobacteriia bacterium]
MTDCPEIRTRRLLLRCWRDEDKPLFATITRDPRVMEFLGEPLSKERSDALVDWFRSRFAEQGFGFWALELLGESPLIGMAGLNIVRFDVPFASAVEVGWRLDPAFWDRGFATEAGSAALDFAFDVIGLDEVVAFTAKGNLRSRRVMERLGMHHDPADDFDHPLVALGSPLRHHVLYRLKRCERGRTTASPAFRLSLIGAASCRRAIGILRRIWIRCRNLNESR